MALEPLTVNQLVGRNIWRLRDARGWSQPALAGRLQTLTGDKGKRTKTKDRDRWNGGLVSRCEWPPLDEDGAGGYQREIPLQDVVSFARAFKVSAVELLTPGPDETVILGNDELPSDAFMWLIFKGERPEEWFGDLFAELGRLVGEGKFAGWVTEQALSQGAPGEAFLPSEREALASEDFDEFLGQTTRGKPGGIRPLKGDHDE